MFESRLNYMRRFSGLRGFIRVVGMFCATMAAAVGQRPFEHVPVASSHELKIGGATIQVDFAEGKFDLGEAAILGHVETAAHAVATYYGRFPVTRARVLILPVGGRSGVLQGTTWGGMGGWPGFTRMRIGEQTGANELAYDWMMTHELVHTGFPSLPDENHWMEEGLATYVEPLARVMIGDLPAARVWGDMMHDMGKGNPQAGDEGLDRTHTWGRTYWGGALFCLVADVGIRRETANRKGLQDALRAIVAAGGTIDQDWDLPKALEIGDRATGTHVLTHMYAEWKDKPVDVDLPALWEKLGVRNGSNGLEFVDSAPLAAVRRAIAGGR